MDPSYVEAKELLPTIYNGLMAELLDYHTKRSNLSKLERLIYNVALTGQRCNLCTTLSTQLYNTAGFYSRYTPVNMRHVGSDIVYATYEKLSTHLNNALLHNKQLTNLHKAGLGTLNDILTQYKNRIDPLITQLRQHINDKPAVKIVSSCIQIAIDYTKFTVGAKPSL
jgi:hypothetical protein